MAKSRRSNITIAQGAENKWPEEIQSWLESYNEGEEPPPPAEQRLRVRLARDVKFGSLRNALIEAAHGTDAGTYEPIVHFLEAAFGLPGMWRRFQEQSPGALLDAALPLYRAADSFLRSVSSQQQLASVLLARSGQRVEGERRYEELVSMVKQIQTGALSARSLLSVADLPKMPRKRNVPTAGERFFAQNLVRHARDLFGVPLYQEVGELAALCLDLPHPLSSKLVMEYCRERRKVAIRKKK